MEVSSRSYLRNVNRSQVTQKGVYHFRDDEWYRITFTSGLMNCRTWQWALTVPTIIFDKFTRIITINKSIRSYAFHSKQEPLKSTRNEVFQISANHETYIDWCYKLILEATRINEKQRWICLNSSFNTELTINKKTWAWI